MKELHPDQISPWVRYAAVVTRHKSYPQFLSAYDYRLFYCLDGHFKILFSESAAEMSPGTLVIFPPGTPYRLEVDNAEGTRFVLLNFDFDMDAYHIPPPPTHDIKAFDSRNIISKSCCAPFDDIFYLPASFSLKEFLLELCKEEIQAEPWSRGCTGGILKFVLLRAMRLQRTDADPAAGNICQQVMDYVETNFRNSLTNISVATHFGYHPYYLSSLFVRQHGITLHQYIITVRLRKARQMLLDTGIPLRELAEQCGFSNQSYFSESFKAAYGITPTQYRKQSI